MRPASNRFSGFILALGILVPALAPAQDYTSARGQARGVFLRVAGNVYIEPAIALTSAATRRQLFVEVDVPGRQVSVVAPVAPEFAAELNVPGQNVVVDLNADDPMVALGVRPLAASEVTGYGEPSDVPAYLVPGRSRAFPPPGQVLRALFAPANPFSICRIASLL
jgi:hypothetical protein